MESSSTLTVVEASPPADVDERPRALSIPRRFRLFLMGVLYPLMAFWTANMGGGISAGSLWQDGRLTTYTELFLRPNNHFWMLPLVAFPAICMSVFLVRPSTGRHPVIRCGIALGVLVSVTFFVATCICFVIAPLVFAAFVLPIQFAVVFALSHLRTTSIRRLMITTCILAMCFALLSASGATGREEIIGVLVAAWYFSAAAATPLAVLAYVTVAFLMWRRDPIPVTRLLGAGLSLGIVSYMTAMKLTVDRVMLDYATLPTSPPAQCFVVSAAAHGHPRFVGSRKSAGGRRLNKQLLRLKRLECYFAFVLPVPHGRLRRIYNRIGPPLAAWIGCNVWLADLTFAVLKPLEWLSALLLRLVSGVCCSEQVLAEFGERGEANHHQRDRNHDAR